MIEVSKIVALGLYILILFFYRYSGLQTCKKHE